MGLSATGVKKKTNAPFNAETWDIKNSNIICNIQIYDSLYDHIMIVYNSPLESVAALNITPAIISN